MLIDAPARPPSQHETEALIREARQRQLRRRLLGAAAVAVAAAAVLSVNSLVTDGGRSSTGGRAPVGVALSMCRMSSLAVKEIGISNPTGLGRLGLQFTNVSSSPCRLDGYPNLRFSDAKGIIPFRFRQLGTPRPVTVPARGSTFSIFSKYRCDYGDARPSAVTTISLPGGHASTSLARAWAGPAICRHGIRAEGRWITVTPFQSLRAAYQVSLIGNGFGPST
jgi:hypothetical protein